MSFVVTIPEALAAVATDLAGIGSTIGTANAAAAVPTTTVLAAAADEVSAAMAALFSGHAQAYQALSAQAALFHEQFVRALTAGAGSYAAAEAASAAPLEGVLDVINAPALALLGRPLIGNGANGAPGTGANGGDGGILIGNGGAGGSGAAGMPGGNGGAAGLFGPRRAGGRKRARITLMCASPIRPWRWAVAVAVNCGANGSPVSARRCPKAWLRRCVGRLRAW